MLIGEDFAQELINYTDKIYLEFGADTKIEGINTDDAIKEIRKNAIKAGWKLVDCPIRHLGTEKAQELYLKIQIKVKTLSSMLLKSLLQQADVVLIGLTSSALSTTLLTNPVLLISA